MQTPGNRWKKSHPHSVRQPESPAGQHADRPSDQQAGGLSEARGGGRNWAVQMVTSMMLLASIDEWKNQRDSHTHLIWCSHVKAQLQTERWLTERLLTETWPSMSVSVLLVYVIQGGLECDCPCVCVCVCVCVCMFLGTEIHYIMQAADVQVILCPRLSFDQCGRSDRAD